MIQSIAQKQITSSHTLCDALENIAFSGNIIYNPLIYARQAYEEYVSRYGNSTKRIVFLGMNPGPWGMAQTGVPFGEINAVRDWLSITAPIGAPETIHPKRPVFRIQMHTKRSQRRTLVGTL
jgi:Uracil DNA glycosylase superfamily.